MSNTQGNTLLDFLNNAHTPYHAVADVKKTLLSAGFVELFEQDDWALVDGKGYFVIRHSSSLIAFVYRKDMTGFSIGAAHTDSPTFRVKGELYGGACTKLDVEKYGGMLEYTWFDRPLTVAGRAFVKTERAVEERLVYVDTDLCVIPSVAPHMSRQDSFAPNVAVDLCPVISLGNEPVLMDAVASSLGTSPENIVSHDLFLALRERGRVLGAHGEFILSRKLDDLSSLYCLLQALISADLKDGRTVPVLVAHDHEEIGSMSTGGAWSTFLHDVLLRIAGERYLQCLAASLLVSADNAHAIHPNHPEYSDKTAAPTLGGGVVIKYNSNRRYATDARSDAYFRTVCERAGVSVQSYFHRADKLCGSTLGTIATTVVSVPTVDIGLPQLAMHSSCEMLAASDVCSMIDAMRAYYETDVVLTENGYAFS